jgi:hypothetical protein
MRGSALRPSSLLAVLAVLGASVSALGQGDAGVGKPMAQPPSSTLEIKVPTRLAIETQETSYRVRIDPKHSRTITVEVRAGMLLGTETTLSVLQGAKEIEHQIGLSSGASFDHGESIFPAKDHQGARVEVRLKLFETDVPVQSHWAPASSSYRVLWEGTISGNLHGP